MPLRGATRAGARFGRRRSAMTRLRTTTHPARSAPAPAERRAGPSGAATTVAAARALPTATPTRSSAALHPREQPVDNRDQVRRIAARRRIEASRPEQSTSTGRERRFACDAIEILEPCVAFEPCDPGASLARDRRSLQEPAQRMRKVMRVQSSRVEADADPFELRTCDSVWSLACATTKQCKDAQHERSYGDEEQQPPTGSRWPPTGRYRQMEILQLLEQIGLHCSLFPKRGSAAALRQTSKSQTRLRRCP